MSRLIIYKTIYYTIEVNYYSEVLLGRWRTCCIYSREMGVVSERKHLGAAKDRKRREQPIKNYLESWFIQNTWENYFVSGGLLLTTDQGWLPSFKWNLNFEGVLVQPISSALQWTFDASRICINISRDVILTMQMKKQL